MDEYMFIKDFMDLPEMDYDKQIEKLSPGDLFLTGESMINQKLTKKINDSVSAYKLIEKKGNKFTYTTKFYILKGEK